MKKSILMSIIPSAIIAVPLLVSSKKLISFSETAALISIGLALIGIANIGRKKIKKN